MTTSSDAPFLPFHEWCIVLLFCLILLVLAGFAFHRPPAVAPLLLSSELPINLLEVRVEGQVEKPGIYQLPLNTTVKDLLEKVMPLPTADLSGMKRHRKLQNGQTFHIPKRQLITVRVMGAVEKEGMLEILSGTRCFELADQLHFLPNADVKLFCKKKGFLCSGDIVSVPFKRKVRKK